MEGGIGFGLGAALYGAITLKDGHVEQSNFNDYRVLRMMKRRRWRSTSCPRRKPTGVGEPGLLSAVAYGVAAAGKRLYVFPFANGEKARS